MAATTAQCIFCFDVLAGKLERRKHSSLARVEELWAKYKITVDSVSVKSLQNGDDQLQRELQQDADAATGEFDDIDEDDTSKGDRPKAGGVARLQCSTPASSRGSSSPSSSASTRATSQASSSTSLLSNVLGRTAEPEYPVFITWNVLGSSGQKSLRGCIGTFEAAPVSSNLETYTITSALHDHRFSPISISELPRLGCNLTLLVNFAPCEDPMEWDVGTHGLRISFRHHGARYGSTYLPDVAPEQGWTKEETIVSLMRKAGWSGNRRDWRSVSDLKVIRYEGITASATWEDYKNWRAWCKEEGLA